jgi:phosphohistidine phosphatase
VDLYLIRHADAVALGEGGITEDEARPLSEEGERQAQAAARALTKHSIRIDGLYASPLLRARQTAERMLAIWSQPGLTVDTRKELEPGAKPRRLSRFLLKQEREHIALVGHMPHLAEFAAWLIGSKKAQLEIAKAGVAYLSCGEAPGKGMAVLHWLVTPEWFSE